MSTEDANSVRQGLRDAMRVESFGPPADPAAIAAAADHLGVAFPRWLRDLCLACDGFLGPTAWPYLLPLSGRDGVVEFTEFLRGENWAPSWLNRAVVFGSDVGSGTSTVNFCALDGDLIEWCLGDGAEFTRFDGTVYDLYRREQAGWERKGGHSTFQRDDAEQRRIVAKPWSTSRKRSSPPPAPPPKNSSQPSSPN